MGEKKEKKYPVASNLIFFSERESSFSLRSQLIRPSDFFRPKSKASLRDKSFAWAPVLRVFDKLHEVGVSSYLFYFWFKCCVDVCVGLRP